MSEHITENLPIEGHSSIASPAVKAGDFLTSIVYETDLDLVKRPGTFTMPLTEMATLGATVAGQLPALRTITSTTQMGTEGLFRIANSESGALLKAAKDGNYWGAFKTASGSSKSAKLSAVDSVEATTETIVPINQMMLAMAVSLYKIEHKLDDIQETQRKIFSFLENEKESQIEADLRVLSSSLEEYKNNWSNDIYVQGHYKQALDIKRTAEKNIRSYQKELQTQSVSGGPVAINANIAASVKSLRKTFNYYRMSLYTLALASLVEILMLGDFGEERLMNVKQSLNEQALSYRGYYTAASLRLEETSKGTLETNVLKGLGTVGKTVGSFIGGIPLIKKGPIDEWLQDGGTALTENAAGMGRESVKVLAGVSDPGIGLFAERIEDLNRIFNHTSKICFDNENVYLIA